MSRFILPVTILFVAIISSPISTCRSEEPVRNFEMTFGNALVYRTIILCTDKSGKTTDSCLTAPFEIKDCDADTRNEEAFLILGKPGSPRGERLAVFSLTGGRIERLLIDENHGFNPWRIRAKDIDGDTCLDICVGVWKKTRFCSVAWNSLFVYGWDGKQLFPKWLGSSLSSPLVDFELLDMDGDGSEELLALEAQRNGQKRIMCYRWNDFGFEGIGVVRENLEEESLRDLGLGQVGGGK